MDAASGYNNALRNSGGGEGGDGAAESESEFPFLFVVATVVDLCLKPMSRPSWSGKAMWARFDRRCHWPQPVAASSCRVRRAVSIEETDGDRAEEGTGTYGEKGVCDVGEEDCAEAECCILVDLDLLDDHQKRWATSSATQSTKLVHR
mgnify:CR=1 FL=1